MRLQEGILLDKMKIRIGVVGVTEGVGATFVSRGLDWYLNEKDRPKVFITGNKRFEVTDSPGDVQDQDIIIAVMDPLPSLLMKGKETIEDLLDHQGDVRWIINRDNPGVNKREMLRFLGFRPGFIQEEIPREYISRAEYNCIRLSEICPLKGIEELAEEIRTLI